MKPTRAREAGRLSARGRQVLALLLTARSSAEIAAEIGVSRRTLECHVSHVYERFGVHSRVELMAQALAEARRALAAETSRSCACAGADEADGR
ncbi:MAG TPA: helix-turn-helix transcriptional regulator [Vicinamibacterales bacterium]|nr:helix-turn-helix transcriptional regulator [Vicinamibacterales bacterium]